MFHCLQDPPKLQALPELVTVCPPAMRCLVYLWDQICSNCVQIGQSNMIETTKGSPSSKQLQNRDKESDSGEVETKKKKKKRGETDDQDIMADVVFLNGCSDYYE